MNRFITLHDREKGKPFLISIDSIVKVKNRCVFTADAANNCQESYSDIVTMIQQAEAAQISMMEGSR